MVQKGTEIDEVNILLILRLCRKHFKPKFCLLQVDTRNQPAIFCKKKISGELVTFVMLL